MKQIGSLLSAEIAYDQTIRIFFGSKIQFVFLYFLVLLQLLHNLFTLHIGPWQQMMELLSAPVSEKLNFHIFLQFPSQQHIHTETVSSPNHPSNSANYDKKPKKSILPFLSPPSPQFAPLVLLSPNQQLNIICDFLKWPINSSFYSFVVIFLYFFSILIINLSLYHSLLLSMALILLLLLISMIVCILVNLENVVVEILVLLTALTFLACSCVGVGAGLGRIRGRGGIGVGFLVMVCNQCREFSIVKILSEFV